MIRSLSSDGCLLWVRDMIAEDLVYQAGLRDDLDAALLKCGINCKLSTESECGIGFVNSLLEVSVALVL